MKASTLIYISLVLATCVLFFSSKFSSSLSYHSKEQQPQGDLILTYPIKEQGGLNSDQKSSKVIKEEMIKSRKGGLLGRKVRVTMEDDEIEDLTYHIDYHGVTTHPTPTPKHPQPMIHN
ncbi:uncharacterized protein LOC124927625 [Impatiens glandulifera]|uniref:uncharacterized protein LOC124927625 n=1 Tax=Impatiens glandulifera TaxID=253017 RepID=UPI001FB058D5|nr:uncharacterized protein LOC124927625 [Impatiens glandulifera]